MNMAVFFLVFFAILLLGGSVAFSMVFCSALYMITNGLPFMLMSQRLVAGVNSFVLLAIPFFILASNIMNSGGVTDRIFKLANRAVGWIPGGLGHANILASVIFAGMSGSAVADAAGLGKIEIKAMEDSGYDKRFAAAITGGSAIIGPIIPPSIPLVLYGVASSLSIGKLFVAGVMPGVLMALFLGVMVVIECVVKKYPREPWAGFRELFRCFCSSFLSLLTPAIILLGMLTGIVTPTEAAILAIVYSMVLAFVYKQMSWKRFHEILVESIETAIPIMAILCAAQAFGWVMANEQVPQMLLGLFMENIHSRVVALLVINVLLLIIGCFMEAGPVIIILTPVLLPIVTSFGVDPIHFGVIMVLNLMIGLITPPVGVILYILQGITGLRFKDIVTGILPYLFVLILTLMLTTFVPALCTYLPGLLFK